MRLAVAAIVVVLAAIVATPALAGARTAEVQISITLRSDYRFTYDYVDRTDPDCPATYQGSSRVVTEMTTVRPARFRIKPLRARGRTIYELQKRLGGGQRGTRSVDMQVEMTRSAQGGSETPCTGYEPFPTQKCGKRGWALDGQPRIGPGELHVSIDVPVFPSLDQMMKDDEWRRGGCGYDSTNADTYITSTRNEQGRLTPSYTAPVSLRRLLRPGRRTLRLRDAHSFTAGKPYQLGGGYTEVRTVEATIRRLR